MDDSPRGGETELDTLDLVPLTSNPVASPSPTVLQMTAGLEVAPWWGVAVIAGCFVIGGAVLGYVFGLLQDRRRHRHDAEVELRLNAKERTTREDEFKRRWDDQIRDLSVALLVLLERISVTVSERDNVEQRSTTGVVDRILALSQDELRIEFEAIDYDPGTDDVNDYGWIEGRNQVIRHCRELALNADADFQMKSAELATRLGELAAIVAGFRIVAPASVSEAAWTVFSVAQDLPNVYDPRAINPPMSEQLLHLTTIRVGQLLAAVRAHFGISPD
jgi:hypothetical protein